MPSLVIWSPESMLRNLVLVGWVRVWWGLRQCWWRRWRWPQVAVTLVVWCGAGLAVCLCVSIQPLTDVQPSPGQSSQPQDTPHEQAYDYTSYEKNNVSSYEKNNVYVEDVRNRNTLPNSLEVNGVNKEQKISNLHHPENDLQNKKNRDGNLENFQKVNLSHHNTNRDLLNNVFKVTTNDSFKSNIKNNNHSNNYNTQQTISEKFIAKNPLPAKSNNSKERRASREKTHPSDNVKNKAAPDEEVKENAIAPRVILLLTTWRSGSTFMGELLASALPRTFYR